MNNKIKRTLILFFLINFSCSTNTIKIEYNNHIFIKTKIQNKNATLLLDSGAEYSCLDSLYFKKNNINLNFKEKILISGIGNNTKLLDFYKDTLEIEIGKKKVSLNNFVIIDLKKIIGKQIDGILGIDYLKKNIYNIDYLNNRIKYGSTEFLVGINLVHH